MLLLVSDGLDPSTLACCDALLKQANWTDGRVTAGILHAMVYTR